MLSGGGGVTGTYDTCPAYLTANFSPNGAPTVGATYLDNHLNISICNQDLTQNFSPHLTNLRFEVWNEFETEFTGTFICSDSVGDFGLGLQDFNPPLGGAGAESFEFSALGTRNARFEVEGVASPKCMVSRLTTAP